MVMCCLQLLHTALPGNAHGIMTAFCWQLAAAAALNHAGAFSGGHKCVNHVVTYASPVGLQPVAGGGLQAPCHLT